MITIERKCEPMAAIMPVLKSWVRCSLTRRAKPTARKVATTLTCAAIICDGHGPSKWAHNLFTVSMAGTLAAGRENSYLLGMSHETRPDWDSAWQGMEPRQSRPRRGIFFIALAAALFLLFGVCALAYFALQQSAPDEPGLSLPAEVTDTAAAEATAISGNAITPESDNPAIAPTVTLPGGDAAPADPSAAADVVAQRVTAPPTIDGNTADWAGLAVYSSPHIVFTSDTWDGSDDVAASWQVSWDDNYLYFIASVADDIHAQNQSGNQTFRGDSIELQIDAGQSSAFSSSISPDDFQITLSPGDFAGLPPSAFRFQGTPDGSMLDAATPHGIMVAATPSSAGYLLEAAIPWRDIGLTPAAGLVLGLAVNINDNDHPGTAIQEMMKSSSPNRRFGDPTSWGTLTLQ